MKVMKAGEITLRTRLARRLLIKTFSVGKAAAAVAVVAVAKPIAEAAVAGNAEAMPKAPRRLAMSYECVTSRAHNRMVAQKRREGFSPEEARRRSAAFHCVRPSMSSGQANHGPARPSMARTACSPTERPPGVTGSGRDVDGPFKERWIAHPQA